MKVLLRIVPSKSKKTFVLNFLFVGHKEVGYICGSSWGASLTWFGIANLKVYLRHGLNGSQ
jgi:3-mercaptopyruvate sulfurtransferase SseA